MINDFKQYCKINNLKIKSIDKTKSLVNNELLLDHLKGYSADKHKVNMFERDISNLTIVGKFLSYILQRCKCVHCDIERESLNIDLIEE